MFTHDDVQVWRGGTSRVPEWLVRERFRLASEWHDVSDADAAELGSNATPRDLNRTRRMMRDSSYIIFYVVDSDDPERLVAMFDGFIGRLPECFAEGDEEYWEGNEYFNRMAAFGLGVNGYYLMVDRRWLGHGLGKLLAEAFTRFDYGPEYSYLFADLAVPGVPRVRKIFVENLDYQPSRFCVDDTSGNEWRIFVKARDGRRLITDNDGWAIGTAPAI